ncbi:hypothetical protein HYFRA_00003218 [Hymenoscyphus fraxineus]|uniref:Uncharacterized protein n=1 Tax=Hymenoscyphus fraxineus TaxID=746836 RepID=A0A9N9KVS5_9HELO|nr:hypothetical protein HYFRA_00003218 [Hymenoscyphus fraxineus]
MSHSNHTSQGHWMPKLVSVQPSVLLAIFAGISTASLDILLADGIAVVWWMSALDGSTLRELHYIWNKGDWRSAKDIFNAVTSGPSVLKVILVTGIVRITKITVGPLLQRATHTVRRDVVSINNQWSWTLGQTIPDGWVGSVGNEGYPILMGSPYLRQIAQQWQAKTPIPNAVGFCNGNCTGRTLGAGIVATCNSTAPAGEVVDLTLPENHNVPLFTIDFNRFNGMDDTPTLKLTVKYTHEVDSSCNATLITETCNIQSAIVEYDIVAQDEIILELDSIPKSSSLNKSLADSISKKPGAAAGLLTGLEWFGYYYLHANATLLHNMTSDMYTFQPTGILASQYSDLDYKSLANCAFVWHNPTSDILRSLHQIAMRIAITTSDVSKPTRVHLSFSIPLDGSRGDDLVHGMQLMAAMGLLGTERDCVSESP